MLRLGNLKKITTSFKFSTTNKKSFELSSVAILISGEKSQLTEAEEIDLIDRLGSEKLTALFEKKPVYLDFFAHPASKEHCINLINKETLLNQYPFHTQQKLHPFFIKIIIDEVCKQNPDSLSLTAYLRFMDANTSQQFIVAMGKEKFRTYIHGADDIQNFLSIFPDTALILDMIGSEKLKNCINTADDMHSIYTMTALNKKAAQKFIDMLGVKKIAEFINELEASQLFIFKYLSCKTSSGEQSPLESAVYKELVASVIQLQNSISLFLALPTSKSYLSKAINPAIVTLKLGCTLFNQDKRALAAITPESVNQILKIKK